MKKNILLLLFAFILIFLIASVSAINFEMKSSFDQEEVLTAKISGDFINPPLKENIYFYRGHVRIAIAPSIAKIGDNYYLFAPLSGKTPANYSIVIEDTAYKKGAKTIEEDLTKNFTITENTASFIIDKGFVYTNEDFYIELENLLDEDLDITMNITPLSGAEDGLVSYKDNTAYEFAISPGSEKINFETDINKPSIKLIQLTSKNTSYTIPVSLFIDEQAEASKFFAFKIEPPKLEITMNFTDQRTKLIYIYNLGTGTLTDIKLRLSASLSPYVTISENSFGKILPEDNAHLNMTLLSSGEDKTISGELFVEAQGQGLAESMRVVVITKEGYVPSPEELAPLLSTPETCESIGGKICLEEEECSEKEFAAKNRLCCPGECKSKPSGSFLKILGWSILVIIVIAVVWFFLKKYKKVKKPVNLLEIARGKK